LSVSDLAFSDPRWRASFEPKPTGMTEDQMERTERIRPGAFTAPCRKCGKVTALVVPLPMRDYLATPPCCARTRCLEPLNDTNSRRHDKSKERTRQQVARDGELGALFPPRRQAGSSDVALAG
jgi:hypothetical protein